MTAWSYSGGIMAARFRSVRLKSRDEFDSMMEHMTHEAYRARDNWDFWGAMEKALTSTGVS